MTNCDTKSQGHSIEITSVYYIHCEYNYLWKPERVESELPVLVLWPRWRCDFSRPLFTIHARRDGADDAISRVLLGEARTRGKDDVATTQHTAATSHHTPYLAVKVLLMKHIRFILLF